MDPHPGAGGGLLQPGGEVVVGTRVAEERREVRVRGQLQVLVAEPGGDIREVEQAEMGGVERGGVKSDLHHGQFLDSPVRQAPG